MGFTLFFLDLFAGAGGLAEGFLCEGFDPVGHVEMDIDAINTLRTRLAYHYLNDKGRPNMYIKYLNNAIPRDKLYDLIPSELSNTIIHKTLSENTFADICNKLNDNMALLNCKEIDVLIGGPPCQTYSIISRSTKNYENKKDQRNHLYKLYAQLLGTYNPKFFIFENVPGLKNISKGILISDLINYISNAGKGYTVKLFELNSFDYGVLQNRNRIIIVGWQKRFKINNINFPLLHFPNTTVNDLLLDLCPLLPGEEKNNYIKKPNKYLIESGIRKSRRIPLTLHLCRTHNENDREIYRHAINLWNEKNKRLIYSELPKHLITRTNPNIFSDKYKVVAGNSPSSHTIIAHIAKDGHYYIHPDIDQARSLSVREAARIQSFPDDYFFEGTRSKKFTQIGNAVPPLMAKQLAKGIKEALLHV